MCFLCFVAVYASAPSVVAYPVPEYIFFAARLTTMVTTSLHDDFFGQAFQRSIRECPSTAANSFSLLGEQLFVHLDRLFCATLIWFFGLSLAGCFLSFSPVTSSILIFDFTVFSLHISKHAHNVYYMITRLCRRNTVYTLSTLIPRSSRKSTILSTCHRTAYRESKRVQIPGLSVTRRRSDDSQHLAYSKHCLSGVRTRPSAGHVTG